MGLACKQGGWQERQQLGPVSGESAVAPQEPQGRERLGLMLWVLTVVGWRPQAVPTDLTYFLQNTAPGSGWPRVTHPICPASSQPGSGSRLPVLSPFVPALPEGLSVPPQRVLSLPPGARAQIEKLVRVGMEVESPGVSARWA